MKNRNNLTNEQIVGDDLILKAWLNGITGNYIIEFCELTYTTLKSLVDGKTFFYGYFSNGVNTATTMTYPISIWKDTEVLEGHYPGSNRGKKTLFADFNLTYGEPIAGYAWMKFQGLKITLL